jgi:Big-like domain-containing protein
MRITKKALSTAILAGTALLLTAGIASAQAVVNLTASQQSTILPDGNSVPMWGWTCGTGTAAAVGASCTSLTYANGALTPQLGGGAWQPPLIVVPYVAGKTSLTINLTNSLPVETSLVILGQSGGGLGAPVREAGPRTDGAHGGQTSTTWTTVVPGSFAPPAQGNRVRSFTSIEVPGVATVGATPVTTGTAGAPPSYSWSNLTPGTYLIRSGTYPSIQGPMGLYGVLVVTTPPATGAPGIAYPVAGATVGGVTYDADVVALESELDPRQNNMVAALFPAGGAAGSPTANPGFNETMKWTAQCGAAANSLLTSTGVAPTCYPPAVDYTPLYFFVNGLSFSKDARQASALSVPAAGTTGNVLIRYVNAGSHMHVPTVTGLNMLLVAEDGHVLPDVALALAPPAPAVAKTLTAKTLASPLGLQLRNEVFQAAGKVFDVLVSPPQTVAGTYDTNTFGIFDRSLALSTNSQRDGGMQAILDVNDSGAAAVIAANSVASVNNVSYRYAPGVTLAVTDPSKGVLGNAVNAYGVQLVAGGTHPGTLTLYPNGTFTYLNPAANSTDVYTFSVNGSATVTGTITFTQSKTVGTGPVANNDAFTSANAALLRIAAPGVLANDVDPNKFPMSAVIVGSPSGGSVSLNADGSFTAVPTLPPAAGTSSTITFTYQAKNSQGSLSNTATATLTFQGGSGLNVTVQDAVCVANGGTNCAITDYKWIIEQDLTIQVDPACQQNGPGGSKPATCPPGTPLTLATVFHTSYMPVVAEGCTGPQSCEKGQTVYDAGTPCTTPPSGTTPGVPAGCSVTAGQHVLAACDGYGICTVGAAQLPASLPSQANLSALNPNGSPASYYLSILPGDSSNAFGYANTKDPSVAGNCTPGANGNPSTQPTGIAEPSACGHQMGGSPIPAPVAGTFAPVVVNVEPEPLKTATVTAWVFEDDYPLNGEPDGGGGVDVLANQEPGLGDFQIIIWDSAGGIGDDTGQMTYDMFNVPLTNALNGTVDPQTGLNACPLSNTAGVGIGVIIVCPLFESDGQTLSPLAGQVVVRNLMQGKFALIAHPGATREANGEEWLQTNSLDGGPYLDSFIKSGEPAYFQEYGPGGYHVFFAMANPKIINNRLTALCNGTSQDTNITSVYAPPCRNTINGQVTNLHSPRSPSETLYGSGVFAQGDARNYAPLAYTNCFAAIGDTDGATIAFAKCDPNGNFSVSGLPDGNYGVVIFDQWDDFILDGSSRPANVHGGPLATDPGQVLNMEFPTFTWQTHLWTNTYMDLNGNGIQDAGEPGLIQVPVRVRQVNGKPLNVEFSELDGSAAFDETFPAFAWYTVESDTTRFRSTGVHAVNDAGGQLDGPTTYGGNGAATSAYQAILNSNETFSLPPNLWYPGTIYCAQGDPQCSLNNFGTNNGSAAETCKTNADGVTSTCTGLSSGRIDPSSVEVEGWQGGVSEFNMLDWGKTPYVAGETGGIRGHVVNATTRPFNDPQELFQNLWEPLVPNVTINLYVEGTAPDGTTSLTLVDSTTTSSFDAWAQGFRADGVTPNMNCPGQDPINDPFFGYTLAGTRNYLTPNTPLPYNSQYKCFEGYHNLNQLQPAPYDGLYEFPSATCLTSGPAGAPASFTVPGNSAVYTCATVPNPAYGQPGVIGAGAKPRVLPPGKYVTEVVTPQGWELVKEEDLNLLIGDQYIAPAVTQFGGAGLGNIFITPDQASIDAANPSYTGAYTPTNPYTQPFASNGTLTPNTTNNGAPSNNLGRTSYSNFGPGGLQVQSSPCVGLVRIVPDYLSIAPESGEVAPFAGTTRALCDRKEVTLNDAMQANADFFIYTDTPKSATYTGFISDDFSSEFDPASPAYGEKFAIPNVPISNKDFNGVEISRVYSDQWGNFNGLVYSTWEVDPPNITGYSPNILVNCMNDPGPILDTRVGSPTYGKMITDPYFNPAYSIFCYEDPFMPGDTMYMDVPVVPVSAFADGYNPPDCAYPDATPAIASAVNTKQETNSTGTLAAGSGPWVAAAGDTLTVTALGVVPVPNNAYSGPAASTPPYNLKTVNRNYHFGTAAGTVTIGGVPAATTWGDTTLTVTVPAGIPDCAIQQQGLKKSLTAQCGELVITSAPSANDPNGQQSIDTVTVTVGGKVPTVLNTSTTPAQTIQSAIDAATPGDMIIIPAGIHNEMLLMWKPLRLQGVGAASSVVNANIAPAGKLLDPWRRKVDCLFGLALNGASLTTTQTTNDNGTVTTVPGVPYDPTGQFTCPASQQGMVQPIPLEGIVGWDASLNGNLAELLQEPSLMGAYEGAAITVLGQGVYIPPGVQPGEGSFPTGARLLTGDSADCKAYPGNFLCNPSGLDGLTFTNSSQGGGGIWLHAWNHYMQIANNRVYNNGGTLSGGLTIGQPENPDAADGAVDGSSLIDANGNEQPYLYNQHVNVHNNYIALNASYGDELGSNTPASAGGISFCTGADYYKFNYNFVCGNLSSGNGGGFAQFGFDWNGDIEHNTIVFNQSVNPTLTTYGGGMIIEGQGPDGTFNVSGVATECGSTNDADCPPGLSDGTGPGLVINANLFQGNTAEEGSGGGLELQHINGSDVARNPRNPSRWYEVTITNNIFANNVAGWDGGGVSMHDAVNVNFINNTVVSNDSTATAGVLFDTIEAPGANQPPPGCDPTLNPNCIGFQVTQSNFLPAGLSTEAHTANFLAAFTVNPAVCPAGHPQCAQFSNPVLTNNLFFQNRSFRITAPTPPAVGPVQLVPALTQATTGACPATGAFYWDIGVYNDTSPTNHASGLTLNPQYSMLTSTTGYAGTNVAPASAGVVGQFCNGSRVPPEIASQLCAGPNGQANAQGCIQPGTVGIGYTVPSGVPDSTPPPLAQFSLTPAATVDEGSNWINMFYGPLSLTNPTILSTVGTPVAPIGNYALAAGSPAIDQIPRTGSNGAFNAAPHTDFFGNPRPDPSNLNAIDIGAVEYQGASVQGTVTFSSGSFGSVGRGTKATLPIVATVSGGAVNFDSAALTAGSSSTFTILTDGCSGTQVAAGSTCTITLQFAPVNTSTATGTLRVLDNGVGSPQSVALTGTGADGIASPNPEPLAFGTVDARAAPVTETVIVSNTGPGVLTFTTDGVTGANFTKGADTCAGASVGPGLTCSIAVILTPTIAGASTGSVARTGTLAIHSNGSVATVDVGLTATVVQAVVAFSAPTPSLTTTPATTGTKSATITVTNSGGEALTLAAGPAITKTAGANAANVFSIAGGGTCVSGYVIAAGGSCTIAVQYVATTTAGSAADVSLNDTGAAAATQTSAAFSAN